MNPEWKARYETLVAIARQAGQHALQYFPDIDAARFADQVIWKSDSSPVTIADREAEALMRQAVLDQFPGDGFLGEEFGETPSTTGFRWVVDPIDGTRSFVRGIAHWATLGGIEFNGEPVAGVAFEPVIDRMWRALRGDGAFRDDARIGVSNVERLADSVMFFSTVDYFMREAEQPRFAKLVASTQRQRGYGDYYGHLLVAQGAGELMIEHNVHEWDVCGLRVIVEEAGGRYSDWAGNATTQTPDCLSTNGRVHEAVLDIMRGGG